MAIPYLSSVEFNDLAKKAALDAAAAIGRTASLLSIQSGPVNVAFYLNVLEGVYCAGLKATTVSRGLQIACLATLLKQLKVTPSELSAINQMLADQTPENFARVALELDRNNG